MVYKYLDGNRHIYVVDDESLIQKADELFNLKEENVKTLDVVPTQNPLPQPKVTHKTAVSQKTFNFEGFTGMTPVDVYHKYGIKGIMLMYKIVGKVEDRDFAEQIINFCKSTILGDVQKKLETFNDASESEIKNFVYLYMPVIEQAFTKILQSRGFSDWNGFTQENDIFVQRQVYEALLIHLKKRVQ